MFNDLLHEGGHVATALVLEDEALVSTLIEDCLRELGIGEVVTCATTVEAVRHVTERHFHVAVLDVRVRDQDSFPIADLLHERGIPFVFASGYAADVLPERHKHRPFLAKPFPSQLFADTIRTLVKGTQEA